MGWHGSIGWERGDRKVFPPCKGVMLEVWLELGAADVDTQM